jgi:hypothetical protein|tara:strand:+ start:8812 stop:9192 length:381 start_codon:yes stop_codon:yes gene_type:complete
MAILGSIFSGLFKSAEGILDTTITNKEELQQVKNELQTILNDAEKNASNQVTERWKSDNLGDNKLSKNIRPMSLIFVTIVFVIISFMDGNVGEFKLNESYIPVYQTLLLAIYGAYFVGRTITKSTK